MEHLSYPHDLQDHESYPLLQYSKNRASRTGFLKPEVIDLLRKNRVIHSILAVLLLRLISYSEINEQPGEFMGQAVPEPYSDKSALRNTAKKRKVHSCNPRWIANFGRNHACRSCFEVCAGPKNAEMWTSCCWKSKNKKLFTTCYQQLWRNMRNLTGVLLSCCFYW